MSKLVSFLFATSGAVATSVGGVGLLNREKSLDEGNAAQLKKEKNILFESVEKFKEVEDVSNYDCLKDDFSGLKLKDVISSASSVTFNPTTNEFFKTDSGSQTTPFTSCLLINWKKTSYGTGDQQKWHGKFTGLGTFVRGDEGFINFNVSETHDSEASKFKFSGVFYLLDKENPNGKIKYKQEVASENSSDASGQDSIFPKKGNALDSGVKKYWEFLEENGDLAKMCKPSDCGTNGTPQPAVVKKFIGTGSSTGSQKIKDGSENLDWWKKLYEHSSWNLSDKLPDTFIGAWISKSS